MDLIQGLRADVIPPRHWPWRRWFAAGSRYYHAPRTGRPDPCTSRQCIDRIDPDLRALCRLVTEAGLITTPSCQGHFHGVEHFRDGWDSLLRERGAIATRGLVVRDAETDRPLLFRDPCYQLPWTSFAGFYADSMSQRGLGYLGVLVPPRQAALEAPLSALAARSGDCEMGFDAQRRLGGMPVFHILVHAPDPGAQTDAWNRVTQRLAERLQPACFSAL